MRTVLKIVHLTAMAVFIGSIPAHIVLAGVADPVAAASFAALQEGKMATIRALTLPGLAVTVVSGLALAWQGRAFHRRWVRAKVALSALIAINGALVLTPTGQAIAAAAREGVSSGTVPAVLAALETREAAFGAVNLLLILAVIVVAVRKAGEA